MSLGLQIHRLVWYIVSNCLHCVVLFSFERADDSRGGAG